MIQPHTTDNTIEGRKRARNAMRLRLWANDVFAHKWLCHPERECEDGCDTAVIPERVELYQSDLE